MANHLGTMQMGTRAVGKEVSVFLLSKDEQDQRDGSTETEYQKIILVLRA